MLPWVALTHVATFLLQGLDEELGSRVGLSILEQDFLSQLERRGGGQKMTDLARALLLSKAGLTKLVDRMEAEGLVERSPSSDDRRVIHVGLTAEGGRRVRRSRRILEGWVEENFGRLLDPGELDALRDAMRKVLEAHGRWEGQMAYLRGEGRHPGRD